MVAEMLMSRFEWASCERSALDTDFAGETLHRFEVEAYDHQLKLNSKFGLSREAIKPLEDWRYTHCLKLTDETKSIMGGVMLKNIFCLVACFFSMFVEAGTIRVEFNCLNENSPYVVYGEVKASSYSDDGSGEAFIEVKEVFRGSINDSRINFKWSSNRLEQGITEVLGRYIFFLEKEQGHFKSSVRGVSVWDVSFLYEREDESVVLAMPLINVPTSLYENVRYLNCQLHKDCIKQKITLKTLRNFFNKYPLRTPTGTPVGKRCIQNRGMRTQPSGTNT